MQVQPGADCVVLQFYIERNPYINESVSHSVVSDSLRPHCSPLGSSVHGILQVRILEWVAIPFSRGSSRPGDPCAVQTHVIQGSAALSSHWASPGLGIAERDCQEKDAAAQDTNRTGLGKVISPSLGLRRHVSLRERPMASPLSRPGRIT